MKSLLLISTLLFSGLASAEFNCEADMPEQDADLKLFMTFEREMTINYLDKNWDTLPLFKDYNKEDCVEAIEISIIDVNGYNFVKMTTFEDSCDGGNTFGIILQPDLKTEVAEIGDSFIMCPKEK